jgi:hypothetical protein
MAIRRLQLRPQRLMERSPQGLTRPQPLQPRINSSLRQLRRRISHNSPQPHLRKISRSSLRPRRILSKTK